MKDNNERQQYKVREGKRDAKEVYYKVTGRDQLRGVPSNKSWCQIQIKF